VQGLYPLAVQHVSFLTREALDGSGGNQAALEAAGFKCLEDWGAIHPGGLHRYALDAILQEAVGHGVQVGGVVAKGAYDLGVVWPRNTYNDFVCADIHPGGVWLYASQPVEGANFNLLFHTTQVIPFIGNPYR